jgi:WD40 repeat protein
MPCGGMLQGTPAPPPIVAVPFNTVPNGRGVTFLSDTVLLTQGDSGIILWDVRTGQVLPSPVLSHSVGSTTVSTSSRDGALLATTNTYLMTPTPSSQIRVSLWNLNTGQLMRHLSSSSGTTNTNLVAISPDSRLLATASTHGGASSGDSTVRLWRLM